MQYIATYRQALRNAEVIILISATFAYLEAMFSFIGVIVEYSKSSETILDILFSYIFPYADVGLIVFLGLLMMTKKSTLVSILLLAYYIFRLVLGLMESVTGFAITPLLMVTIPIHIIGLFSVVKYQRLLPLAELEEERALQFYNSNNIVFPVLKKRQSISTIVLGVLMLSFCFNAIFLPFGIIGLVVAYAYKDILSTKPGVILNSIGIVASIIITILLWPT